ncbi:MAG: tyrosine-type recombinase/integrase [Tepidisphaeraceae bacterium]
MPYRVRDALNCLDFEVWSHQASYGDQRYNARKLLDILGNVSLQSITPKTVDKLLNWHRDRRYAFSTINRRLATLSGVLRYAETRGWINNPPEVRMLRVQKTGLRFLSPEEETLTVNHFYGVGERDMANWVEFILDTGLRAGEALTLRTQVALDGVSIVVKGSDGRPARTIPQTDRVRRVVRSRVATGLRPTDRLFGDLSLRVVNARWKRYQRIFGKSGKNADRPIILRETFIVRLVRAGRSLDEVAALAGLKNQRAVLKYVPFMPVDLKAAVALIERPSHPSLLSTLPTPERCQDPPRSVT